MHVELHYGMETFESPQEGQLTEVRVQPPGVRLACLRLVFRDETGTAAFARKEAIKPDGSRSLLL